jgi:O-antigen ligase
VSAIAFDTVQRDRLRLWADGLAAAVAASLPWSVSATCILLVLWLIVLLPVLDWNEVRRQAFTAAGGLPVLLVVLGAAGMLWADVSLAARWDGFDSFPRLLVIPLLFAQFCNSDRGVWALYAFFVSCLVLLIASVATFYAPILLPNPNKVPGVPVKDYIAQSSEFTICAFGLLFAAARDAAAQKYGRAAVLALLPVAFFVNVFYIAGSRTAFITIVVLLLAFAVRLERRARAVTLAGGAFLLAAVWVSSPYTRHRAGGLIGEVHRYIDAGASTSAGERLEYWRKSFGFISDSLVVGHGTGSIRQQFRGAATGTGVSAYISDNPHNQILAVAVQLGLIGAVVLVGMWAAHFLLFWSGRSLAAWVGLVVTLQNIIGSLFNSHLFDFTHGWIYVIGVGIAGGIVLRERALAALSANPRVGDGR